VLVTKPELTYGTLSRAVDLDLSAYRPAHIEERIRRALEREDVPSVERLTRLLMADPGARARLRRSIAVSVSGLFRDPAQFDVLEQQVIPVFSGARRVAVCSVGCSDGSELYSIAQVLDRAGLFDGAFLLGCDLLEENLELARLGVYDGSAVSDRYRDRARWERRDVVRDGIPDGKWRLVLCRNVAIYLAPAAKHALHAALAASLAQGGFLLLGRSERLGSPRALGLEPFAPHVYRRAA
jgi:chemotaxis protein methyltransferase CheR